MFIVFRKSCLFRDNVEKYDTEREDPADDIIRRTRTACWITKATNTLRIYNIIAFSRNNDFANAHQCFTLYVLHCLPCLFKRYL